MPLTLTLAKLRFPLNENISEPIEVTLEIKEYYATSWTLIDDNVNVEVDGTISGSPLPSITIDPELKYVLRATNELCGLDYTQALIINPYCQPGYTMAPDSSYCYWIEETEATPPSDPENTISQVGAGYCTYGTVIFDLGYSQDGTGTFTQIPYVNVFWVNGPGYPTVSATTTDGPLNRSGVWSTTVLEGQRVGYAVCVDLPEDGIYYAGLACNDRGTIRVDGNTIVDQDRAALGTYFRANGYPGAIDSRMGFIFFYIYPVFLTAGTHVIEVLGINTNGVMPNDASVGVEVYNLTAAEITAATSYVDLGAGLIFSSKDYVGQPIQVGSDNIGYSCPVGFSLQPCTSPVNCVRVLTTPVLY